MRSWQRQLSALKMLRSHFRKQRVRSITTADLEAYKLTRLRTPKKDGSKRPFAGPHRELSLPRTMLNYSKQQGWLDLSPFPEKCCWSTAAELLIQDAQSVIARRTDPIIKHFVTAKFSQTL
jgi:hypothetical protein